MMTVKTMKTRGGRRRKKKSNTKGTEAGDLLEGLGGILWSSDVMFSPAWFWRWGGTGIAFLFHGL